ncbi:hypothetical protein PHLGIDRAFT_127337 [Phlebiopsis gigantea 11061_1 CR5-6]|uniref:Peptidase C14 caspase domain-containing protein n=1 Tax=Phlebiopsis gigantea (strain 11061_1 CR5-6) TaxID=745531 RepID=A0A0C3NRU2_PHLG1|nr:hypothetical protein PHLGIDRAFT_127337 [Phlebiopsis gigantea 11061_1 CR5-6]
MAKKALCIGVSYQGTEWSLKSTFRDVDRFRSLLVDRFGYADEDITVMKDDGGEDEPTRDNMLQAMENLAQSASKGDHLVFYFAGHGEQEQERPGKHDEKDGMDEAICPSDYRPGDDESHILDDTIRATLVGIAVNNGAHLVVIFDCCHSGTAADLDNPSYKWVGPSGRKKAFRFGPASDPDSKAVSWAACQDPQVTLGGPDSGLFTKALASVFQEMDSSATHGVVLDQVRDRMTADLVDHIEAKGLGENERAEIMQHFESKCHPQVQFLLDDASLMSTLSVEETFVDTF